MRGLTDAKLQPHPWDLGLHLRGKRSLRSPMEGAHFNSKTPRLSALGAVFIWLSCLLTLWASPFTDEIVFTQPDGAQIEMWGSGDEFYAWFETLDGYSVVFDRATRAYCFARVSRDGAALESTGVQVHRGDPRALGLPKHLRIKPEAVKLQVAERRRQWAAAIPPPKALRSLTSSATPAGHAPGAHPLDLSSGTPIAGLKVGLCLLIDFDDDPATIPQSEIVNFCNGDNYTGFGNNGSVKQYFFDNSNGLLTYSNVATAYIRIPNSLHPKSYYNDPTKDAGAQANLLIRDALSIMQSLPDYQSQILPAFDALTVDTDGQVLALNVFFAGGSSGVWMKGLWPHSWGLANVGAQALSPGGKTVFRYQISDIGSSLSLGSFCHENGHMLCGFPDLYDGDFDSRGGAGLFCLMDSWGLGINPCQICACLKRAAGWATTTDLDSSSKLVAVLSAVQGTNFNHFYRYSKPGVPTEYFLLENRQQTGHDFYLPAAGIAVWHIDELGDSSNQSLLTNTSHANYLVTLVQADNQWDFERNVNSGDFDDLYYLGNRAPGYQNLFSDDSHPGATWWDGTSSGLRLVDFSAPADTMTARVGADPPPSLAISGQGAGPYLIRGDGSPGRTYRILFTTDTQNPDWQPLSSATADASGFFSYLDSAGSPQRFYRSVSP